MKPIDFLMGVTVAVTWGMGLTFAKAGMSQFPPIFLIALRFSVTALALAWFVRPPVGSMGRVFLISFVIGTVQYSLTFTGLNGLDVSLAAIIIQMEVPFATLMAVIFLGDRMGWWRIAGRQRYMGLRQHTGQKAGQIFGRVPVDCLGCGVYRSTTFCHLIPARGRAYGRSGQC
jgi:uncharacterized membrane protein